MSPRVLTITCEACGQVSHFEGSAEKEIADIFNAYYCPNGCEQKYYSYISVGEIVLD